MRWTFTARLVVLSAAAWTLGWGVTRIARSELMPEEAPMALALGAVLEVEPQAGPAPELPTKDFYQGPILARSIFDSSRLGRAAGEAVDLSLEQPTTLEVVLLATTVTDPPDWSSALIGEPATKRIKKKVRRRTRTVQVETVDDARGYGVGDRLLDSATIVEIAQGRVTLERDGGRIEILTFSEAPPEESSGREPSVASNTVKASAETIRQLEESPQLLLATGRASRHKNPEGEVDGVRLMSLRSTSLGRKIGLKSGDIVHSVEGRSVGSPDEVLEALSNAAGHSSFEIEITRRRVQRTIQVEVN